jgi:cytochrome c biogenesis protein CcmG/thiol:disulfide interchange protein DsbE
VSTLSQRAALLGTLVAVLGLLAFVTLHSTRPATIASALARGKTPEAPGFVLPRLDAEGAIDLRALRGRVVVVNFWASWCVPCRDEAPALQAAWERYRDRGVVVLGVNVQDLVSEARRFLGDVKTTYPSVRDRDNAVYRAYGLTGVPETFFIDRAGRIVFRFPGVVTEHGLWFKAIDDVLTRQADAGR